MPAVLGSGDTRIFLARWGVIHLPSTPHNPESNGHAEAVVKLVKRLVQKPSVAADLDSDDFARVLLEIRIALQSDGRAPAQVLFGHLPRSAVVHSAVVLPKPSLWIRH